MLTEKPNYYGIIPANVRYDKDLSPNAKLFYSELTCLASKEGYCFASNNYFAQLYNVVPSSISNWVKQLTDKGYINVEYVYEGKECKERRIYISDNCIQKNEEVFKNNEEGIQKIEEGYSKILKDNNTSNNNINNNNTSNNTTEEKAPVNPFILKNKNYWYLSKLLYENYKQTYSNIDVDYELKKMQSWLLSNQEKRKTEKGMPKFINNWLSNAKPQLTKINYQNIKTDSLKNEYMNNPENWLKGD